MNSSKKLTSEEILETYGIKFTENPDKVLLGTSYRVNGFEFDKNAVIHWFMGMNIPAKDRRDAMVERWVTASSSLFRYIAHNGWMKNNQAKIVFRPHRRHPVQDQISEIEHWAESVLPVQTNYGISTIVPLIDRSGRENRYHMILHEENGRTVVKLGCPIGSNRYETSNAFDDIFDAVYYAKDNLYVDSNGYIPREKMEGDFFYNLERKRADGPGNSPRDQENERPDDTFIHPDDDPGEDDPDETDDEDNEQDDPDEEDDPGGPGVF